MVGLAGITGAGYAALLGLDQAWTLFGDGPSEVEVAESRRLFRLAAVIAASVPLIGLVLAAWVRRRRLTAYFVVLLMLGSLFAGAVGLDQYRTRAPEPVERGPRACQESSGGDNRCSGG